MRSQAARPQVNADVSETEVVIVPRGFHAAWSNAVQAAQRHGVVSPQTESLARELYVESLKRPLDEAALKLTIDAILRFLASPEGRTEGNCYAVSVFLDVDDDWEGHWQDVPDTLFKIMASMSREMYKAVSDPEWTGNYGALPEQLLARLREVEGDGERAR